MELVFSNYGINIYRNKEKYYIRFDGGGELVYRLAEIEVTPEDAALAQKGEQYAFDVIIKYTRNKNKKDFFV